MSSNRPTSPATTLTLDGVEYQFRLDFTAMADFEKASGRSIVELIFNVLDEVQLAAAEAKPDVETATKPDAEAEVADILFRVNWVKAIQGMNLKAAEVTVLVWACMGGDDSDLSIREVGRLLHPGNLPAVFVALSVAIRDALPAVKQEGEQSLPPGHMAVTPGPDGSPSGASDGSASA